MDQQFINVDDNVREAEHHCFHQPLEASQGSQKASGSGDALVLPLPRNGECCVWSGPRVEEELPKSRGEDCASCSANFANALADLFQMVLFRAGVGIEGPEVLDQADLTALIGNCLDQAVELAAGGLDENDF